jgi:hypothetical protein
MKDDTEIINKRYVLALILRFSFSMCSDSQMLRLYNFIADINGDIFDRWVSLMVLDEFQSLFTVIYVVLILQDSVGHGFQFGLILIKK